MIISKIVNDFKRMEKADELFTKALIDLERHNYTGAIKTIEELLKVSISIEQRAGAMFLMSLAQTADVFLTKVILKEMYDVEGVN
ncbi:hypothetical protein [Clostridium chrysemydis]|uniref:hypothetical protein n=1 Tax=Clostridium chrysemydis TaxID=2665504 RepID=UPI0018846317|nr:hypothetical protein [Clostridium chrysemydis]